MSTKTDSTSSTPTGDKTTSDQEWTTAKPKRQQRNEVKMEALDAARLFYREFLVLFPYLPIERGVLRRIYEQNIDRLLTPGMRREDFRFGEVLFALATNLHVVRVEGKDGDGNKVPEPIQGLRWQRVNQWHRPDQRSDPGEPLFPHYNSHRDRQVIRTMTHVTNDRLFYPTPPHDLGDTRRYPKTPSWGNDAIRSAPTDRRDRDHSPRRRVEPTRDDVDGRYEPRRGQRRDDRRDDQRRTSHDEQRPQQQQRPRDAPFSRTNKPTFDIDPKALELAKRFWMNKTSSDNFWECPKERSELETQFNEYCEDFEDDDHPEFKSVLFALSRGDMKNGKGVIRVVKGHQIVESST
jgi:hypothetical protein